MDLKEYFRKYFEANIHGYYHRCKIEIEKELKSIPGASKNPFVFDDVELKIIDFDDAINTWKQVLIAAVDSISHEDDIKFLLTSFFLFNNGYQIEQFPSLLKNIKSLFETSNFFRIQTSIKFGFEGVAGGVKYEHRREFIRNLTFKKLETALSYTEEDLEVLLRKISLNDIDFKSKSLNEQLVDIRNAYENLTITTTGFDIVNFEELTFNYITSEMAKDFTKRLHAFRHAKEESLLERGGYSDEQKKFFVDFGILLLHLVIRDRKKNGNK
jgi:hypothetical protein